MQLLLYAVFRIGNATNNITWQSYQDIAARPEVAWIVPLSLGDSHRGFRVLGTTRDYFEHYRYRRDQPLAFAQGRPFADLFDAVLGADVAAALGYRLGDPIVVAHGLGSTSFALHDDKPFRVAGILAKTGTPVDRTVHVSLEAIEAIHVDWQSGARVPGSRRRRRGGPRHGPAAQGDYRRPGRPEIEARRLQAAALRQRVPGEEPLSAILPGVALQELWSLVGVAETALGAVSAMVVVTALLGMVTMILATLNERRREMAILRAVGARPAHVLGLLAAEAGLLALAGAALGVALLYAALLVLRPLIDARFGLYLEIGPPGAARARDAGGRGAGRPARRPASGLAGLPPVAGRRHDRADMSGGTPTMITGGRAAALALAMAVAASAGSFAEWATRPASDQPEELAWEELIPRAGWLGATVRGTLRGVVQHGSAVQAQDLAQETAFVTPSTAGACASPAICCPSTSTGWGARVPARPLCRRLRPRPPASAQPGRARPEREPCLRPGPVRARPGHRHARHRPPVDRVGRGRLPGCGRGGAPYAGQ